jgi:hypothetical protein
MFQSDLFALLEIKTAICDEKSFGAKARIYGADPILPLVFAFLRSSCQSLLIAK